MKNSDINGIGLTPDSSPRKSLPGYVSNGGELILSNPGQLDLLQAMEERGVALRTMVRGYSMTPFIKDRDVLTITPFDNQQPRIGEVVAFKHPENGRLVIHRIIKRTDSDWLLKGDNCQEADGYVSGNKIIGRVIKIERNKKKVSLGLGASGRFIAFLNCGKGLEYFKKICVLPRRIASSILRQLQCLSFYRSLASYLMPFVVISEATENDLEAIHRRLNPSVQYTPQKHNPNVTNFVATTGNKLLGFAQLVYHPEENYPWVGYWAFSLHVYGLYRGLGIGEKLARHRIEAARSKGASEIFLLVYNDNKRAIGLNQKLGFVPVTLPAVEPLLEAEKEKTGRRRIVMQKDLKQNHKNEYNKIEVY